MTERTQSPHITVALAARRANLATVTVYRYVQRNLVRVPLTEDDLAELRRIRRLTNLGINLAGVEIILRLRRQIEELQAELARREARTRQTSASSEDARKWKRALPRE